MLQLGLRIEGSVANEVDGSPIGSARILYHPERPIREPGVPMPRIRPKTVNTSSNGRFVIDGLSEGDYRVSISHPEYYSDAPLGVITVPTQDVLDIRLKPAARLHGTIANLPEVDRRREYYQLKLILVNADDVEDTREPETTTPEGKGPAKRQQRLQHVTHAFVSPSGSFEAQSLKPGRYRLELTHARFHRPDEAGKVTAARVEPEEPISLGEVEVEVGEIRQAQLDFSE